MVPKTWSLKFSLLWKFRFRNWKWLIRPLPFQRACILTFKRGFYCAAISEIGFGKSRNADDEMVLIREWFAVFVLIWVLFLDGSSWRKNGEHIPHSSWRNPGEHNPHWDHLLRSAIVLSQLLWIFFHVRGFERGFLSHPVFDGEWRNCSHGIP